MTYVLSDVHGQKRRWDSILKQIDLQPEDTLYVLGDVIDRYPDGIRILRQIMSSSNMKMLLGNHELMMLEALYYPSPEEDDWMLYYTINRSTQLWYNNGGRVTHDYLKRIRKTIRTEIFEYLDGLPYNVEIEVAGKHYILTHSAPAYEYPIYAYKYDSERDFAVWKRHRHFSNNGRSTIIFGHTPTAHYQLDNPLRIFYEDGWIGIDCGCSYRETGEPGIRRFGRLACLRLEDMKEFYSEEPALEQLDIQTGLPTI